MREIALTKGKVALVDDEDYDLVMSYGKWQADRDESRFYARTSGGPRGSKGFRMHRVVLNLTDSYKMVDHIDRNTLNNQKCNLRVCTQASNARNRSLSKNNSTGFKGVFKYKYGVGKYTAMIRHLDKLVYLGIFDSAELAAEAYNEAALRYHGEFASLNKLEEGTGT